jgi:hypothetical protein
MTKDLSKIFDDGNYAIYLPALSGFYATMLGKYQNDPTYIKSERIPSKFEKGLDGLDFLKEDSYYHYRYFLYSAGHSERDLNKALIKEPMVHKRSKKTMSVGDSGGFQIATGVIKFDWAKFKDKEGDKLRQEILTYLENTFDWSMTLDIPAFAASERLSKKTGLTKFEDTLDYSVFNLHYFMKNRTPGKTKFLNVLSGSSVENSKIWYDEVKKFSIPSEVRKMGYDDNRTLEGYAFAGINMKNMYAVLQRMLDLIDDNLLAGKDWIHFLGLGRLDWACFLTAIKRELQKHYNPNLNISFDAASPFVSVAYALAYNYNHFNAKRFIYSMAPAYDNKTFEGNYSQMPFLSPIMDRLTLHDLCPSSVAHAIIEGEHRYDITEEECTVLASSGVNATWQAEKLNRLGKTSKTSWDTLSYLLYMSHNVYKHIEAVAEANRVSDAEYVRLKPKWKDWIKDKKSKSAEVSDFAPNSVLYFRSFVEELFQPGNKDARQMLDEFRPFLEEISFGGTNDNMFNSFFETAKTTDQTTIDQYADQNNEETNVKLTELENLDE